MMIVCAPEALDLAQGAWQRAHDRLIALRAVAPLIQVKVGPSLGAYACVQGTPMTSTHASPNPKDAGVNVDGFDVLDACHRQTLQTLDKLTELVTRLTQGGADVQARTLAAEIVHFFSTTARQHHEDEERHVFPKLAVSDDPQIVHAVLRLSQDHNWLEEDWMEISPHIDSVACGLSWHDLDTLREGVEVFAALSRDHIALEESLIYPQARARLDAGERREMGREMAKRRRALRGAKSASAGPGAGSLKSV